MRFIRFLTRRPETIALATAILAAAEFSATPAWSQGPARPAAPTASAAVEAETSLSTPSESHLRLNYINKAWDEVLLDVAEKTGSKLVMPRVPPGKYTHTGFGKFSREDAIRVINRDLEQVGYRITAKNEYLQVLSTRRTRHEYPRPEAPSAEDFSSPAEETVAQEPRRLNSYGQPGSQLRAGGVQQTSLETTVAEHPAVSQVLSPSKRTALDIARQLHKSFDTRSQTKTEGTPNGLPSFVVAHYDEKAIAESRPLFEMEIDTTKNELVVTAPAETQKEVRQLVSQLDVDPLTAESMPVVAVGEGNLSAIGEKLQGPIAFVAQAAGQQNQNPAGRNPLDVANQVRQAQQQLPLTGDNAQAMEAAGILGGLKGPVTIESIPGLDILILKGNQADIEEVMKVVEEIERMAIGSLPGIHLIKLQHVDSRAMATLLSDLYTQLTELRAGNAQLSQVSVRFLPVVVPNAILVLAPESAIESVQSLIQELDQDVDPSFEVQVLRLEHAPATTVVEQLQEFYGDEEPEGLSTRLRVSADVRTNSIIVQARPRDLSEISKFVKEVDKDYSNSVSQMKIFPLKSASAEELAQFLNAAIQSVFDPSASALGSSGNFNQQQNFTQNEETQAVKGVVLEFLNDQGQQLVRSGLLNDIRFNADPRTNSLLVTAPQQSMPLLNELITMLDRPSDAVAEIKVFKLNHADAIDAVTLLNELFNQQTQNQNNNQQSQAGQGLNLIGTQGSPSSLLRLTFSADARTNSVVATGGADALVVVEGILALLDDDQARDRQTVAIKLRNSPADLVADALNQFLQAQRDLATLDPDRISTSQLLEQEIIVTPEVVSNQLIISATPDYLPQIEKLVRQLDAEPLQVVIQAMLVEVTLENTDEFGVELGFQDSVLFDRSLIGDLVTVTETIFDNQGNPTTTATRVISQTANPGFQFNTPSLGNNNGPVAQPAHVGTQGLSSFALGRTNSDLGYGGLVLSASSEAVNVLIRALAARRTLRVLSRPQILSVDNQVASIQVGQDVPVANGVTITGTGVVSPTILRSPAGIILTVSPRISPEGQVVMEVVAEKSFFDLSTGVPIFTDPTAGTITAPIKNITTAQATVKVPDGQTAVVGGMITKSEENVERKIPWFGDLPLVGAAFRYNLYDHRRTELLIFLTPRLVRNPADTELVKRVETDRLHFFQEDLEALHGPIFATPSGETFVPPGFEAPQNVPPMVPGDQWMVPPGPQTPEPVLSPMSGPAGQETDIPGAVNLTVPNVE